MNRPLDDELFETLSASLDGDADPATLARADAAAAARPEVAEEAALLRAIRATTLDMGLDAAPPQLRARVREAIARKETTTGGAVRRALLPRRGLAAAAAALLALGLYRATFGPDDAAGAPASGVVDRGLPKNRVAEAADVEAGLGVVDAAAPSARPEAEKKADAFAGAVDDDPAPPRSTFDRALLAIESIRLDVATAPSSTHVYFASAAPVDVAKGFDWNMAPVDVVDGAAGYAPFDSGLGELIDLEAKVDEPLLRAARAPRDDLSATVARMAVEADRGRGGRRQKDVDDAKKGDDARASASRVLDDAALKEREDASKSAASSKTRPRSAGGAKAASVVFVAGVEASRSVERLLAGAGAKVLELPVIRAGAASLGDDAPSRTRLLEVEVDAAKADALADALRAVARGDDDAIADVPFGSPNAASPTVAAPSAPKPAAPATATAATRPTAKPGSKDAPPTRTLRVVVVDETVR